MGRLGSDWTLTAAVVAAIVGLVIALVVLTRVAYRVRTAFAERLHALPGARWWRRLTHAGRFWVGLGVQMMIGAVMVVYIVAAVRFLTRIALA